MVPRFGAYEIVEEIGRGGMGVVYRAREIALDRDVALKVIAEDSAAVPVIRARFERESRLAASISHPHIVAVHAVGEHEGRGFIAMQWVDGGDLRQRLQNGPLTIADTLRLGGQIADALQAAHDRGLLHRDVKPGNVMLRRGPRLHALLGDFGIARAASANIELTNTGEVIGTPLYCAPEQFSGDGAQPKSDVYSLGCVLFACLTGKTPYGDSENIAQVWMAHMNAERPYARELRSDVPPTLDALVRSTLAVDPRERPTAGELSAALEGMERDPTPPATMRLAVDRGATTAAMGATPDSTRQLKRAPMVETERPAAPPPPPPSKPGGRGTKLALAAAVVAAAAIAVVLALSGGGDGKNDKREAQVTATATAATPQPTETATETAAPSPSPTSTATTQANLPTSFSAPADIRALPKSDSDEINTAREVLAGYLEAYRNKDPAEMRGLLNADIDRTGRLADGSCGTHDGIDAVAADYAFNIQAAGAPYYLYGLGSPKALRVEQDGAVSSHGLRFSIGDTLRQRIQFLFRGDKIQAVSAFCK